MTLLGAMLLAAACNFTVAGVGAHDGADAGSAPPGVTPPPGMPPAFDLGMPADLTTVHDLYMADLRPLPDHVGDACAGACAAGLTCMNWIADGYCSQPCNGSSSACPSGSTCVDTGDGSRYCLVNANGGNQCTRPDLSCRDCGASVCGPSSLCDGC